MQAVLPQLQVVDMRTDLAFCEHGGARAVERILYERKGSGSEILVGADDYVLVTLGSMTDASSLGSMDQAPVARTKVDGLSWALWERIAAG